MSKPAELRITAVKAGFLLFGIATCLVAAHILTVAVWYRDLLPIDDWLYISFFDLDEEESLGTWFSALILFAAGQLTLLQSRYARRDSQPWILWWLLGAGFHLLSLDEVAGFHEFVNTVVADTHWTTFGAALVLAVAVAYLPFLWALPRRTRWLFILSGAIYVGGAVGVEWGTLWYEENGLLDTLEYNLWNALEEGMEMVGVILFICALLGHIARHTKSPGLSIRFDL